MGKLTGRSAIGYVVAQLCGAVLGSLPLLLWGSMGRSMAYGLEAEKGYLAEHLVQEQAYGKVLDKTAKATTQNPKSLTPSAFEAGGLTLLLTTDA